MLTVTDDQWTALGDSLVKSETRARALYQAQSVDLSVTPEGDLTWSADGNIQASGHLRVFGHGDSLVPIGADSLLAPFGQEIALWREVAIRDLTFNVPLGIYRIIGNDGGRANVRAGRTLDWEVGVDLADRFRMIERARVIDPASPPTGATVFSEYRRLTLFPFAQPADVTDATVPESLTYTDRMGALHDLAEAAGAKPRITRAGSLTLRPADRWLTETTAEFTIEGTITWAAAQTDEFYNVVWAHSNDGAFSSFAALLDDSDPRSVSRAGPSTYEHSSALYTRNRDVTVDARVILARLANRRSREVSVIVGAQGLVLELGDFGQVTDSSTGRSVLGEVRGISIRHDPSEPVRLTMTVAEES